MQQREHADGKLSIEELADVDKDAAMEKAGKAERARALERVSLKHKNQSKWIKRMLQQRGSDGDTQKAIAEQLNLGDELRKKVRPGKATPSFASFTRGTT